MMHPMDDKPFTRIPPPLGQECWWEQTPRERISAKGVRARYTYRSRSNDLIGLIDHRQDGTWLCVATSTHDHYPGAGVVLSLDQEPNPLATARDAAEALCFLQRFRIHPTRAQPLPNKKHGPPE